ncbi:MAG: ATP-binding protein [Lachnospiraceae bacterium]|nr:ATP-binding protein [Lachnospiraceae bacterium]
MKNGQWLKEHQLLPDGETVEALYVQGDNWQLYTTVSGGYALCVRGELEKKWIVRGLTEEGLFLPFSGAGSGAAISENLCVLCVPDGEWISSALFGPFPQTGAQAIAFARALRNGMGKSASVLSDGIYISRFATILPVFRSKETDDPAWILGRWICGGMNISLTDTARIKKYASWLGEKTRQELLDLFHLQENGQGDGEDILTMPPPLYSAEYEGREARSASAGQGGRMKRQKRQDGPFVLAGREKLEKFFRDEILDVIDREEEYRRFGVGFPGATLLYGPSGSGKTFAVEKLAAYLGWPVFQITSSSVGSKYIHETSQKVSQMFDLAIAQAPSVLIIDEMEAFLSSRENGVGSAYTAHLEEVGEFLRRIPNAAENHVLLFGMTNMKDSIDTAILRRGRFDHIVEVEMPSKEEVLCVLESLLKDLPTQGDLKLESLAAMLQGRPLSDVAFVVSEAGKMSVRAGKGAIDAKILDEACRSLTGSGKKRTKIGFSL